MFGTASLKGIAVKRFHTFCIILWPVQAAFEGVLRRYLTVAYTRPLVTLSIARMSLAVLASCRDNNVTQ